MISDLYTRKCSKLLHELCNKWQGCTTKIPHLMKTRFALCTQAKFNCIIIISMTPKLQTNRFHMTKVWISIITLWHLVFDINKVCSRFCGNTHRMIAVILWRTCWGLITNESNWFTPSCNVKTGYYWQSQEENW